MLTDYTRLLTTLITISVLNNIKIFFLNKDGDDANDNAIANKDSNDNEEDSNANFTTCIKDDISINDVDCEIKEISDDVRSTNCDFNVIDDCDQSDQTDALPGEVLRFSDANMVLDEFDAYCNLDLEKGEPIENLDLEIGSQRIKMFNCANHKSNLGVRSAILKLPSLVHNLKLINKFITSVRKQIQINKLFVNFKCRLRSENATRWSSTFLALEMVKRAHDRGALKNMELPVSIDTINMYLAILKPAYLFDLHMQCSTTSIANVIPNLINLTDWWKSLEGRVSSQGKLFCNLLVKEFLARFDYELNSHFYQVRFYYSIHHNHHRSGF